MNIDLPYADGTVTKHRLELGGESEQVDVESKSV
jgi:hypothetical protein